jgi:hypothetical protein
MNWKDARLWIGMVTFFVTVVTSAIGLFVPPEWQVALRTILISLSEIALMLIAIFTATKSVTRYAARLSDRSIPVGDPDLWMAIIGALASIAATVVNMALTGSWLEFSLVIISAVVELAGVIIAVLFQARAIQRTVRAQFLASKMS